MQKKYDFSGWATRNGLECSDGKTIQKDAFKHSDGKTVPLVWNHIHDSPDNILGHALLENRDEGVYAYCDFNDSENGVLSKGLVIHGDVVSLSIYANKIKKRGNDVIHGEIREVSLVLAGANPGAFIDSVISHGEESAEETIIYTGEDISISHSEEESDKTEEKSSESDMPEKSVNENETVSDIVETMNEKQKTAFYAVLGKALENEETENKVENSEGGNEPMKHNVFDKDEQHTEGVLSHSDVQAVFAEAKSAGGRSLRSVFLDRGLSEEGIFHSVTDDSGATVNYGIANIDYLFPDARAITNVPDLITRDMDWVAKVMNGAKHLPFFRVKSIHANITMDEARAKGYVKANQKANEVFALLKRATSPTTIYHKTKLDRDDVVDITDFDVVAWIKRNERVLLDEEIARAALVGDGRVAGTDDKISEECIRPIWTDNETYTIHKPVVLSAGATDDDKAKAFITAVIKSRKDYKGSGNPSLFTTEDMLTDCLLLEDGNGRVIYDSVEKLRTALRVREINTVPVMENLSREGSGSDAGFNFALMGIVVNMSDYGFGADKGGAVNMFDDFDIDFNQMIYLIETRCSGALMKPFSAIAVELKTAASAG
ncbi:MAG: phage major capsid protein [Clostridia bacterium]